MKIDFTTLRNRKQSVVLNGQCPSWADVRAGVLGIMLDSYLSYEHQFKYILHKVNKTIGT